MTFQVFLEWIRENLFINYPLLIQTLIDRHPLRSQHQQTQPASTELRPVPFFSMKPKQNMKQGARCLSSVTDALTAFMDAAVGKFWGNV